MIVERIESGNDVLEVFPHDGEFVAIIDIGDKDPLDLTNKSIVLDEIDVMWLISELQDLIAYHHHKASKNVSK